MIVWMSLSAFASGLDVERATNALNEGRAAEAIDLARRAIGASVDDVEAWTVYLKACERAGVGIACRSEAGLAGDAAALMVLRLDRIGGTSVTVPPLGSEELQGLASGAIDGLDHPLAHRERLASLALTNPDAAAEAALEVLDAHPDRPDSLIGLFDLKVPPVKSMAKTRKKAEKLGGKRIAAAPPEELYRWLELWIASDAHELATRTAQLLEDAGEARPLDRKPFTRAEQVRYAETVIAGTAELPRRNPIEHEAIALKVGQELTQRGKNEEAAAQLRTAREQLDSVGLAFAEAEAQLAIHENTKALEVANEAVAMAADAWPSDRAAVGADARRQLLARVLGLRGRLELEAGQRREAAIDLMIANQLAIEPVDTAALEKAMSAVRYQLETVKSGLETPAKAAHVAGMERADAALKAGDAAGALALLDDTVAALCLPSTSNARLTAALDGRGFLADALAKRALVAKGLDRTAQARSDLSTAILLRRWSAPAAWWTELAGLYSTPEAAFFANAMAAALDSSLDRTRPWPGLASGSEAAATSLVALWMRDAPPEKPDEPTFVRGKVIQIPQGGGGGGGAGRRPALNAPFPAFSLETPHGQVSLKTGRIALITFFRADSPNSRRAMRELALMAQTLRRQKGIDVISVGVSVDPEEETLNALAGERDTWGPNGWDPAMGKRFGVDAVPTTFVVDTQGVARFVHVGYLGTSEYEAELRLLGGI